MLDGTLRDDQVGVLEGLWRDILCRRLAEGAAGPVRSPAIAGTRIDASVARKPAEALVVEIEIAAIATADLEQVQRAQHSAKGFPVKRDPEQIGPYPGGRADRRRVFGGVGNPLRDKGQDRTEEGRGGKECESTCGYGGGA